MVITGLAAMGEAAYTTGTVVRELGMWQTQEVVPVGGGHLVEIFIGIAALALLAQAAVIVALVIALLKALKTVSAYAAEIKPKVIPIIEKTNDIIGTVKTTAAELSPKITEITGKVNAITGKFGVIAGHATEISGMVKEKVADFGPTVDKVKETISTANDTALDATQKAHKQLQRLNQMVTESLDATAKASKSFRHTITQPGRSIAGAASGVKAAVMDFFSSKKPKAGTYRAPYRSNPAAPNYASTERRAAEVPEVR